MLPAQEPQKRVIHMWVDPHYGDDAQAAANNPKLGASGPSGPSNARLPVDWKHPTYNEVLLHWPWPFLTIRAAVDFLVDESPNNPPLPYTNIDQSYVAEYAIIHLLPGKYGTHPDGPDSTLGYFRPNGLWANGEPLPIQLPPRVSIRGTNALNTIIDRFAEQGSIFEFGRTVTLGSAAPKAIALTGVHSFIDKVTICGATHSSINALDATGIYFRHDLQACPTITNCIIAFNAIGVLLDNPMDASDIGDLVHGPVLASNTFVWNFCGLWNGQRSPPPGGSIGWATPVVLNNVFDGSPPLPSATNIPGPYTLAGTTLFEGVDASDLHVGSVSPGNNYNAYENPQTTRYNSGTFNLWGLPSTRPRVTANMTSIPPNVDLYPWIDRSVGRGVVFVRDLLGNGPLAAQPAFNPPMAPSYDRSGHDFRLAPAVAPAAFTPVPPTTLNPLVDAGWSGPFPMTMANGRGLANEPGFLPLGADQAKWPFHCWKEDCEGFGSSRIYDHPSWPGGLAIDLGADELGELVIPGARFHTTRFLSVAGEGGGMPRWNQMDNKYVWFLGVPDSLAGGVPQYKKRPYFTPNAVTSQPWQMDWVFLRPSTPGYLAGNPSQPTVVDVSPHLRPDNHPWWSYQIFNPSNPFWKWFTTPPEPVNAALYIHPTADVIHPPGAYDVYKTLLWLDGTGSPTEQRWDTGNAFVAGGPNDLETFDAWCRGHTALIPQKFNVLRQTTTATNPDLSVRYSVEHLDGQPRAGCGNKTGANLQSFLVKVQ